MTERIVNRIGATRADTGKDSHTDRLEAAVDAARAFCEAKEDMSKSMADVRQKYVAMKAKIAAVRRDR